MSKSLSSTPQLDLPSDLLDLFGDLVGEGVFPDRAIKWLITTEQITAHKPIPEENIQPASLDLRLGEFAHRLPASILPGREARIGDILPRFSMHEFPIEDGAVLEKGCVYIIPLMEELALGKDIYASANAKSTSGRLDLFTRLITDFGVEFDRIPAGYTGPLYVEVSPLSFSVLVRSGMRLNQIRFCRGETLIPDKTLQRLPEKERPVEKNAHIEGGIGFSVDLPRNRKVVGYRAKTNSGLIDLGKIGHYDAHDFWEPVAAKDGRLILDPGAFYILVSRESVRIHPKFAAEMAPYLATIGEFRVHYAGFFDPGFGMNDERARAVLEVRCYEAPFVLNHGQRVGRLVFERMLAEPERQYGREMGSNYAGQGLRLAKQFKLPE